MSWYLKYQEPPWISQLESRFDQRFKTQFEDPENACAEAISELLLVKLPAAQIKHTSNTDGYVRKTFDNTVLDAARRENGRQRVPLKVEKRGQLYQDIYLDHCIARMPAGEIANKHHLPSNSVSRVIAWLNANQLCSGARKSKTVPFEEDDNYITSHGDLLNEQSTPLDALVRTHTQSVQGWFVDFFKQLMEPEGVDIDTLSQSQQEKLFAECQTLVDNDDRLLLKLVYWEDQSVSSAARKLRINRNSIKYRHSTIMKRLREYLSRKGITRDEY